MGRNKHRDELEYLYKHVKALESENRSLRRELKQVKKFIDPYLEEEVEDIEDEAVFKCPKCKQAADIIQLGPKTLYCCKRCLWRKTETTIKK